MDQEMVVAEQALNSIRENEQQENDAASFVDIYWYFHVTLPQHKFDAFLAIISDIEKLDDEILRQAIP